MSLGIYVSVPFCRSKCSFCNFASGVFSREQMPAYIQRLRQEMESAETRVRSLPASFERRVDSIYLGGGTPTLLTANQLKEIFDLIHGNFQIESSAEVTVECAPGTLSVAMLDSLLACGVNRVSLGTQSFVDVEIRSVGRLHTAKQLRKDAAALRAAGIRNLNIDLIAGLPHQTPESWLESLQAFVDLEVPHASVYMLEADGDSRLGRELLAGGVRYHAHHVPDSNLMADMYLEAIERLEAAGVMQYEISNFSREGFESAHNLKYWTRQPYLGFGLDAHSMLPAADPSSSVESFRFGNTDELNSYLEGAAPSVETIDVESANEERLFLGLRLNRGVDLSQFSESWHERLHSEMLDLRVAGLIEFDGNVLRLTRRGRLLSNEVFERFIGNTAICEVR